MGAPGTRIAAPRSGDGRRTIRLNPPAGRRAGEGRDASALPDGQYSNAPDGSQIVGCQALTDRARSVMHDRGDVPRPHPGRRGPGGGDARASQEVQRHRDRARARGRRGRRRDSPGCSIFRSTCCACARSATPGHPELAMGAVAPQGERYTNRRVASPLTAGPGRQRLRHRHRAGPRDGRAAARRRSDDAGRPHRRDRRRRRRHRRLDPGRPGGHPKRRRPPDRDRPAGAAAARGRAARARVRPARHPARAPALPRGQPSSTSTSARSPSAREVAAAIAKPAVALRSDRRTRTET